MRQQIKWEKPKTARVFLQPYLSERLIMTSPNMKVIDSTQYAQSRTSDYPALGVHALFGSEPDENDFELTTWEKCKDGIPVYTMYNIDRENDCKTAFTAFCSKDRVPFTYIELTVTNTNNYAVTGTMGLLPRYALYDRYLFGNNACGYDSYSPSIQQWYMMRNNAFSPVQKDSLTAKCEDGFGFITITEVENCQNVRWVSRIEDPYRFKAHDYYRFDYSLEAGESARVRMVMRRGEVCDAPSYDEALKDTTEFWQNLQSKVTKLPKGTKATIDLYRHQITQIFQCIRHFEKEYDDYVHIMQGDVARLEWIYEASSCLILFDDIGLKEYVTDCIRKWYVKGQHQEGEHPGRIVNNKCFRWDSDNGMALFTTAHHLLAMDSKELFEEFKPYMELSVEYIQYRRSLADENEIKGLFNAGQASDWGDIAQHWTYTDAPNVAGIGGMLKCYEHFGADNTQYIREIYEDYKGVIDSIRDKFAAEHKGEHAYNMPHMLGVGGNDFEATYNHCFMMDGVPNLVYFDFLDPKSELFEQFENYYMEAGIIDMEHGLCGRMTDCDGTRPGIYGHVYYTSVAEIDWMKAWTVRGEHEKVKKLLEGMLKYHVTSEYICAERYCSFDPWFNPFQPNASGSARLCMMLLDYLD